MLLYALCTVFSQYFLSLDLRTFLWIMILCSVGQICGLWVWHASVDEMVRVMVVTMAALLSGLIALYVAHARRLRDTGASPV